MKCLTASECSEWLRSQKMIEAPYGKSSPAGCFYERFVPPANVRLFAQNIFYWFGNFDAALLQMTDWDTRQPDEIADEMALITAIRRSHGESRWLIKAPGHLFEFKERDELVGMFYLIIMFQWSCYIYLPSRKTTILNWEGALGDLWSFDSEHFAGFAAIKTKFQLKEKTDQK